MRAEDGKKRASWRELVFFQSDSVAVKFRAWIFNQNGFPVKTVLFFFGWGYSPYITKNNRCPSRIVTMNRYEPFVETFVRFSGGQNTLLQMK